MFLCSNSSELQFINTIFAPGIPGQINMFEFVNKIMVDIDIIMYDEKFPRVLDQMKSTLHPTLESCTGD